MSEIEKIKLYNEIRPYLSQENQLDLFSKLNINPVNIESRLKGLSNEDEFVMILDYLKCAKHIISINESASFLTKSYQCDLLVQLNSGETFFIEIKSKEDSSYKISGGNLDNRIDFTKDFGFPLYFALKLNGNWLLVTSEYLKNNGGKINLEQDFTNSIFSQKFGNKSYIFPKGITVKSIYSKKNKNLGIQIPPYGTLVSYQFFFLGKLIFVYNESKQENLGISMFLEILHDEMSNTNMETSILNEDETEITERLDNDFLFNDYNAFLASVDHTTNEYDIRHDSTSFYKDILENRTENRLITKEIFESTIKHLIALGLPIIDTVIIPSNKLV